MPSNKNLRYDDETKQIIGKDAHTEPENRKAILMEIANRYPPYSVRELKKGIRAFREEIDGFEKAAKNVRVKLTNYQRLVKQCEERDREVAPYLDS